MWTDLWTAATQANYTVMEASRRGPSAPAAVLNTDDGVELVLRPLSSYVSFHRTRGRAGATHMLGVISLGISTDVAPSWLVSDFAMFSKAEHQRAQRVASSAADPDGGVIFRARGRGRGAPPAAGKGGDGAVPSGGARARGGGRGRGRG